MNLRSNQRDQDSEKHHLLKPLFIVSVIWVSDVEKVLILTQLCDLRVKV
jgi:hypothetical protein